MSNVDHDPVEEFFERERNQIVSQHGNDGSLAGNCPPSSR